MGRRERPVENRLVTRAKAAGGLCWKLAPTTSGIPDRILILGGHIVFVETKAPGQSVRRLQQVRHTALRRRGMDVRVVDTIDDADALIAEIAAREPISSVAQTPSTEEP